MFVRLKTQFALPDHRCEHVCELVNESFEELLATDSPTIRLLGARLSFLVFVLRQKSELLRWMVSVCRDLDGMTVRITNQKCLPKFQCVLPIHDNARRNKLHMRSVEIVEGGIQILDP